MIQARPSQTTDSTIAALLDAQVVTQMLVEQANIDWPGGAAPNDVHIERAWPTRGGGLNVEWSFQLGPQRVSLFGQSIADDHDETAPESRSPVLSPDGLRRLCTTVPEFGIKLQSIDHDSAMPHLAKCLDPVAMRDLLAPYVKQSRIDDTQNQDSIQCRTLAYRLGRRATLAYGPSGCPNSQHAVLGKTYRDDRGSRLMQVHSELDEQLNAQTDGAVRTPIALGYLEELRMVLFAPSDGLADPQGVDTQVATDRAVDVLCALHRTSMPDLPMFTVDDELAIVQRWYDVIEQTKPELMTSAAAIVSALKLAAQSAVSDHSCTVHRDYYQAQLLIADQTTTLLDLDTLARGRACVDIGNFLTHAYLAALLGSDDAAGFPSEAARVLDRYQRAGVELHRSTLVFYWASALFRVGAVHALRTATAGYVPRLWKLAGDVLGYNEGRNDEAQTTNARSGPGFDPTPVIGLIDA